MPSYPIGTPRVDLTTLSYPASLPIAPSNPTRSTFNMPIACHKLHQQGASFVLRYKRAWKLYKWGNAKAAGAIAQELLDEPRLSRPHKDYMRTLLYITSREYAKQGFKAVRQLDDLLARTNLDYRTLAHIEKLQHQIRARIEETRQNKAHITRQVNRLL